MKRLIIASAALFTALTAVQPVWAQDQSAGSSSISVEEERPARLSDLGMTVNPQIGVSSFEYSEGIDQDAKSKFSGGVTVEFGAEKRKLETGLLTLQTAASTYLTIPMAAKIRLVQTRYQAWYGKFGFMPAFEISRTIENARTNNIDVIGSTGLGGRFEFNKKSDFIIEATFNRGLMDAVRGNGENLNQGFLVLAGMSFNI